MVVIPDFKGDIITPEDPQYANAIARWARNAERRASAIAFVKDAADVALAIDYAKTHSLSLAVRGGGHSASGASSSEGGLVIDLSRYLNGVTIDAESRLAYVGGGGGWLPLVVQSIMYVFKDMCDDNPLTGLPPKTGVGGLVLGGGYGWLTGTHGLAIDNLAKVTVVTADGSIRSVSESENPDLWFGIRGGGCNFGVATEFVLKLHPQRRTVYSGLLIFKPDALEQIVKVTSEWILTASQEEGMLHITSVDPRGQPAIVIIPFFNGPENEGRSKFKALFDIGPVLDETTEIPYEKLNTLQNAMVYPGQGVYMKGLSQTEPHYDTISRAYHKALELVQQGFRPAVLYEYVPLHKVMSVPSGDSAFRREGTSNVLAVMLWDGDDPKRTQVARSTAYEIADILLGGQGGLTAAQKLGYGNYADFDFGAEIGQPIQADGARLAFGDKYPRLQEIKRKYDPDNIFNKWFPITPA
uniref:FAD-binding protein n=1 Tax=Volvariella volvacea TaxID=36659 RepID=M9ZBN1_9AGAR|nr:FAD-binding protein [Volvariella volvacea]